MRNWDYTDTGVTYAQGSNTINVTSTDNVAVGMFVSSGRAFPSDTKITSIDSATQVTVSRNALANSAGGGGVPVGTTDLSGSAPAGSTTIATSTGRVVDGETYDVPPGSTVSVATSFSGTDQCNILFSGLNKGMFYKAGQLIESNRQYIIDTTHAWMVTTYPSLASWGTNTTKCKRDIGLFLDAYVYHLKQGGNFKIVEAAQLYYKRMNILMVKLDILLIGVLTEALATFTYAKDLAIQAMRNQLPTTDPNVLIDSIISCMCRSRKYIKHIS